MRNQWVTIGRFTFAWAMTALSLAPQTDALAQTNTSKHWDLAFTSGPFLPSGLPGVREILPFWGVSASHPLYSFRPEYSFFAGRSEGVDYYIAGFGLRNDLHFVPGMHWSIGYEHHRYTRFFATTGESRPFTDNNGLHVSFGFFFPQDTRVQMRTLVRMGTQEGRSIYVGLGLTFVLGPMVGSPATN